MPDGYDTVVKVEETTHDTKSVTINCQIKPGQNVRMPGEDIAVGETVINKGSLLRSLDMGILASIGISKILVIKKPRILILSTGDELAQAGEPLKFGQIYDSNSYTIEALTRIFSSSIEKRAAVGDDIESLKHELNSDHEVIITTGGVSMGEKDLLPKVAEDCGWQPLLHKVAIKPGKPIFVATRANQILFGLPGNPLSAAVTCAVMVLPALKRLIGIEKCLPELTEAILDQPVSIRGSRTLVWPGRIKLTDGRTEVSLAGKRSSAALSALLGSDGLIFVDQTVADPDQLVKALRWQQILSL
jgi:molybdopterin molybdotransferase